MSKVEVGEMATVDLLLKWIRRKLLTQMGINVLFYVEDDPDL